MRYVTSGDAYEAKRQYAEAVIEYRNALKAEPTLADVQLKLGRTYLKAGDAADAVEAMARAADMRPDDADLQIEVGSLQLLAGDVRGAESRAQALVQRNRGRSMGSSCWGTRRRRNDGATTPDRRSSARSASIPRRSRR